MVKYLWLHDKILSGDTEDWEGVDLAFKKKKKKGIVIVLFDRFKKKKKAKTKLGSIPEKSMCGEMHMKALQS